MNRYNICIETQSNWVISSCLLQLEQQNCYHLLNENKNPSILWSQETEFDAYFIQSVRLGETFFKSTGNRNLQETAIT